MKLFGFAVATLISLTHAGLAGADEGSDATLPEDTAPGAETAAGAEVREARSEFLRGTELARSGRWTEALEAFERSEKLRPHAVTTYNVGYVERALGHYTRARDALRRALRPAESSPLPEDVAEEAAQYLEEVEARLAHVRLSVSPPDVRVTIDGQPLSRDRTGATPTWVAGLREAGPGEALPRPSIDLLIDPGAHIVVLSRKGFADHAFRRSVEAGTRNARWKLTMPDAPPSLEGAKEPTPIPRDESPPAKRNDTAAYVALGVGAAGLVAGSVFGILSLVEDADLSDACSNKECPPSRKDDLDALQLHADLATAGFVVGVAGAGVGLFLLFNGRGDSPERPGTALRAFVTPTRVGLDGTF